MACLLARLVFLPAASKVEQKEGITRFRNFLVTEGFAMLAEHKSPRYIQDRMNSFLDPTIRFQYNPNSIYRPAIIFVSVVSDAAAKLVQE